MLFGTIAHLILAGCPNVDDEMVLGALRKQLNLHQHKNKHSKPTVLFVRVKNKRKQVPLRTLILTGCTKLTDASFLRVRLASFSSLTSLSMSQCQWVTDSSVSIILLHVSAPIVSLNFSHCPNITNLSLEKLLENPGNKSTCGNYIGGKLRWLKEFLVHDSGVNSHDCLSWLVESATELIRLGIGRSQHRGGSFQSHDYSFQQKLQIGQMVAQLRRLRELVLGDEHVETVETPVSAHTTTNSMPHVVVDALVSRGLSTAESVLFKHGAHSFTYRVPKLHPERRIQPSIVTTAQSTTPMGCTEHRHSGIAINGILKGFYGDTVIDSTATTTITSLEKQAWWSVDLGRTEKVGCVKILLPEQHRPTFLLPDQFPFWVFCYRNPQACAHVTELDVCPSNALTHASVFSQRVEWDSRSLVGRSIWIKIPIEVPSFQVVRIQQETLTGSR